MAIAPAYGAYAEDHRPGFLTSFVKAFFGAIAARRAYETLSNLSDEQLAAMDLKREDIPARVAEML